MSLSFSAVQSCQDEVKRVIPSMSFSEMIKILENFLSFLDFAVSYIALQLYSAVYSWQYQVYIAFSDHKLHGSISVCCWSQVAGVVSLDRFLVSVDRLLVMLDKWLVSLERFHCTMCQVLEMSCIKNLRLPMYCVQYINALREHS